MSLNNIQDELRDLNSDLPSGNNPYNVPEGYFEGFAGSVIAKIKNSHSESAAEEISRLSPFLAGLSRSMPYAVPDNFFQSVINDLPFITGEDPGLGILSTISRDMPFSVPEGYFNGISTNILSEVAPAKAKVIPMVRSNWKRIAIAAMLTGIIGLSGIFYFSGRNNSASKDPIAQVRNASTNDIEAFLKSTGATLSGSVTAQNVSKKSEIKSILENVPDNEVDAFLNQVPEEESITN